MEIKSSLILKKYEGFFFSIPFTQRFSIMFDAGQAAAYMQLAAWELGIGSVPATIYKRGKAREILAYLEEKECNIALSFGYPEKEDALTRPPQKGGAPSHSRDGTLGNVVRGNLKWEPKGTDNKKDRGFLSAVLSI